MSGSLLSHKQSGIICYCYNIIHIHFVIIVVKGCLEKILLKNDLQYNILLPDDTAFIVFTL